METSKEGEASTEANTAGTRRTSGFKCLTDEEYQRKREKGLCFRCDKKFTPAHRCKNKQLHVLLLSKEVEDDINQSEADLFTEEEVKDDTMALSLNLMVGISDAKSMRSKGTVLGREITVLIDCGATHNFVSHEVVKELRLQLDKGKRFTVEVGDGYELHSSGIYKGVQVQLQGITISQDFYPLQLGSATSFWVCHGWSQWVILIQIGEILP